MANRVFLISMAALVMIGAFAFAGGQSEDDGELVIGFSNAGMGDSWRQFLVANFEAEIAAQGARAIITNADESPEKQVADIDNLLVQGVDALIVYPTSGEALTPAIERAYDSGVPVIVFGGTLATDSYTSLVTQDLVEFGRAQAQWLVDELGGSGKIVMMSGIAGNTTAEDRLAGAMEVFEANPGIEILDHQYCNWSPATGKTVMETWIQTFPEIDGIWADSGLMSWPALQALQEAGLPLPPSTGDQLNGYAKFLVASGARGYVYPMTTRLSAEAVRVAVEAATGGDPDTVVVIDIDGMGPDKIAEFARPNLSDWWWIGDDQIPAEFLPEL